MALAQRDVNVLLVKPVRAVGSRGESGYSGAGVTEGGGWLAQYLLNQRLGACAGSKVSCRGMMGGTPKNEATPVAGETCLQP